MHGATGDRTEGRSLKLSTSKRQSTCIKGRKRTAVYHTRTGPALPHGAMTDLQRPRIGTLRLSHQHWPVAP